ncbi:hypothetical protein ABK040_005106 [Willaertia magna]
MISSEIPVYRILSKSSGLRVFPISLGCVHFGNHPSFTQYGVGGNLEEQEKIFVDYVKRGGNFVDTSCNYQVGQSEENIGKFIKKHQIDRKDLIISTKFTAPMETKPNKSGNHKKNLIQSLEGSLQRLQTDYVDLLYVHVYDFTTDIRTIIRNLDEVIKSGKVLHAAISDCPAWLVARANTYAELHALSPFVAYQGRYSLVDRSVEQEVLPMCKELDIGFLPWEIVAQGKLTGRFKRKENEDTKEDQHKRMGVEMSESDFQIQDKVIEIAKEIGRSPSQVAINWLLSKPGIPSVIMGPRTFEQYQDNMGALEFKLSNEHIAQLDEISKDSPNTIFPHNFIGNNPQNCSWLYMPEKKYQIE